MIKPNLLLLAILLSLTFPAYTQQTPPPIEWQKCFGGTGDDKAKSIIRSYDNGFLVAGSSRSNDGDVTSHYGSPDSTDAWLIKLSAQGTIEWQKNYGGTGPDEFIQVINTVDQEYLAVGQTESVNGDVTGNHGGLDIWVVKLNRQGNIVWKRCLGGNAADYVSSVKLTSDSGYVLVGYTSSANGDVTGNHGFTDVWVVKLDKLGNIDWKYCYGGSFHDRGYDILPLPNNQYLLGVGTESADGDFPGPSGNPPVAFTLLINAAGQVLERNRINARSQVDNIKQHPDGSYVLLENYINCYPLNPNGGIRVRQANYGSCLSNSNRLGFNVTGSENLVFLPDNHLILSARAQDTVGMVNHGAEDGFLSRFNLTGNISWKKCYGGSANDAFMSIVSPQEYAYLCAGYTNSNDGDVTGNHGGYDFWVVKFRTTNLIKGTVYADDNSNGVKDSNESYVNQVLVQAKKDTVIYSSAPLQGIFGIAVDTGTYTVTMPAPLRYHTAVPATHTTVFTGYGNVDSFSIALQPIPGKRDYEANVIGYTPVRPGFDLQYVVTYTNAGTDTLLNKPVKLIKDNRLQWLSSLPAQTNISGDTVTWNIAQLLPRASGQIKITMRAATPPALNNNDTISMMAFVDTTADVEKNNNVAVLRQFVTGSYDPNDKQEVHGTMLFKSEYDAGNLLTYTIRFQNTGTDTAFNIRIRDTLSNRLIGTSLEVIAASHSYKLQVKDDKYCSWTFENILLPDSNRNEPASHGYITYRIKPVDGLTINDKILNRAAIYFDFNLPVITNTQETTIKPTPVPPPSQPLVSGLQVAYCNNSGVQKGKINNLPAANGTTTATVKLDNAALSIATDSTFAFKVDTLTVGQHQVAVTFSNATASKTYTFDFTVMAAVTPDVNLSANITNVVTLTNPVVVTATNASGGGTAPLYTFARDKGMTNILQAEGTAATLTIDPSTLVIGDNKVYVRMKTSATCYTVQTNVDSILLRRDAATGIADVDNPGQVITIFPNPFNSKISVAGLNSGKAYQIVLYNSRGQAVYASEVKNKRVLDIPASGIIPGIYWLSIYDAKRKLIGTEKVIKY